MAIEKPVSVWIALRRPSDQEQSDAKRFLYLPQEFGMLHLCAYRSLFNGTPLYMSVTPLYMSDTSVQSFTPLYLSVTPLYSLLHLCA